jgi:hypothetical protein
VNRQRKSRLPTVTGLLALVLITSFLLETTPSPALARTINKHLSSLDLPVGSRADIIARAKTWVTAKVPYNQRAWYQGYREDCSGMVSMAWGLTTSLSTYTLANVADKINKDELQPGDLLNNADGGGDPNLAHVVIFDSWVDSSHTHYNAYEENPYWNGAHYTTNIPYAFWSGYDTSEYAPMRLRSLSNIPNQTATATSCPPAPPKIQDIPLAQTGGIDLNSSMVQASIQEIQKLYPSLSSSYSQNTQLSTGYTVTILIPKKDLQSNAWTLSVEIYTIDYNITFEQSDYQFMKKSFLEAANILFNWIRSHNADPLKILFVWGNRAFVQMLRRDGYTVRIPIALRFLSSQCPRSPSTSSF